MAPRLSTRISIRWNNEPPSEPTITTVMSVGSHFVDLRVNKADQTIDWAFAGRREIVSQDPLQCRWYHVIDSRNVFEPDEGSFTKLPNGDDLETGSMPCSERNNEITPYEEVWRALPVEGAGPHWILQSDHEDSTAFVGCVGGVFIAMQQRRQGGSFAVVKEEFVGVEGQPPRWERRYVSGEFHAQLPSLACRESSTFVGEKVPGTGSSWKMGDEVEMGQRLYKVVAIE
ncbi:hypothetical protein SPI_03556 [Niveomyces insectorum RCEF 264]|uniref:Protein HRI1 n=1 Tax=Niveomyces insectorum RCEF 264 TaxID=1081102 RepID=A0A167W6C2_9HYPO|nr:hypothetical protein SPI_03556 [Niveomyces insectorum RCEF 264]